MICISLTFSVNGTSKENSVPFNMCYGIENGYVVAWIVSNRLGKTACCGSTHVETIQLHSTNFINLIKLMRKSIILISYKYNPQWARPFTPEGWIEAFDQVVKGFARIHWYPQEANTEQLFVVEITDPIKYSDWQNKDK